MYPRPRARVGSGTRAVAARPVPSDIHGSARRFRRRARHRARRRRRLTTGTTNEHRRCGRQRHSRATHSGSGCAHEYESDAAPAVVLVQLAHRRRSTATIAFLASAGPPVAALAIPSSPERSRPARCRSVAKAIASKMRISAPQAHRAPPNATRVAVYPFRPLSTALVNASNSSAEGGRTCVARIAARSWSGQEYHKVPSPPAQPYRRPAALSVTPSP